MKILELEKRIKELKLAIEDTFVLAIDKKALFTEYELHLAKLHSGFKGMFETFLASALSIISVSRIPYEMSSERAIRLIYDDILRSQTILSLEQILLDGINGTNDALPENKRTAKVKGIASNLFNEKIKTSEGSKEFIFHTLQFIYDCVGSRGFAENFTISSKELINQTTLLTWSTLEILFRDYFIMFFNTYPEQISKFNNNTALRTKFDIKSISTEKLIQYNFNLSNCMGSLLIDNFDFSNIDIIKEVYKCILDDETLNKMLKSPIIWTLYQRRNLIVHRGGIVDSKYLSKTSDQLGIGEKLFVSPNQFKNYLSEVINIANTLLLNTLK